MIRKMNESDRVHVMAMMRDFYASPAVFTNGSEEIFARDIENCISDNPYVEGCIFEDGGIVQGYAMLAKSYSTEFGKQCVWVEDLYIKEAFRHQGIGKSFFDYLATQYTDCIFRLEVEEENISAVKLYEKCGFTVLPYMEMKK